MGASSYQIGGQCRRCKKLYESCECEDYYEQSRAEKIKTMTTETKSAGSSAPRFKPGDKVWSMHDGKVAVTRIVETSDNKPVFGNENDSNFIWILCFRHTNAVTYIHKSDLFATSDELLENIKKQIEGLEK
jgi:hypothetical protein